MVFDGRFGIMSRLKSEGADPIETDLYCPQCGYNLRGLSGNPVRCPECGEESDRRVIAVPAELIRPVLLKMETAPATCVGVSTIYVLVVGFPFALLGEPVAALVLALPFLLAWFAAYRWTRAVFADRLGWKTIVRDFHLATLCWFLGVGFFVNLLRTVFLGVFSTLAFVVCSVAMVVFLPLGVFVYRRARATICRLQRQQAVAMMRISFER